MKTLFYGGKIITMAEPLYAQAAVVENGVVKAAGGEAQLIEKYRPQQSVDLCGAVMIPAFIDSHSHFTQVAYAILQAELGGAKNEAEISQRINDYILKNGVKPGEWITARGYDNNLFPGKKNPSLEELDAISPHNPLVIQHQSGHMGLFNSIALNELGISQSTAPLQAGEIETANGKLTGYMEENAFFEYLKKVPRPPAEKIKNAFIRAQKKYASCGIATMQDGMAVSEMLELYRSLTEENSLFLDLAAYFDIKAFKAAEKMFAPTCRGYRSHFKTGGIKIFLDGSPQGKTAWMKTPYKGGGFGRSTMTDDEVLSALETAAENGVQIIAHCNGDAACGQFLACLEKAESKYPCLRELRPVMIHAQFITQEQVEKAARLGAVLSFFCAHVYHWGDVHAENFGFERAGNISPAKWAEEYGATFTLHQDSPVIEPDVLETLWCAVCRKTKSGKTLGENQKISAYSALKAVTAGAAYQYFEENEKGRIAPGMTADFAVLSGDPLECAADDIRQIRVLKTYKSGRLVYDSSETDY